MLLLPILVVRDAWGQLLKLRVYRALLGVGAQPVRSEAAQGLICLVSCVDDLYRDTNPGKVFLTCKFRSLKDSPIGELVQGQQ